MARVGVSIAVPEPHGLFLQRYRVGLGDAAARGIPTHITLVPPVEITEPTVRALVGHLHAVGAGHRPFRVRLRGTGTFRPVSPVVFVGLAAGISDCEMLAAATRSGPVEVVAGYPYHPHVTVAHDQPDDVLDRAFDGLADYRADFTVDQFWLYLHDDRHGWRPSVAFQLGGSSGNGSAARRTADSVGAVEPAQ